MSTGTRRSPRERQMSRNGLSLNARFGAEGMASNGASRMHRYIYIVEFLYKANIVVK